MAVQGNSFLNAELFCSSPQRADFVTVQQVSTLPSPAEYDVPVSQETKEDLRRSREHNGNGGQESIHNQKEVNAIVRGCEKKCYSDISNSFAKSTPRIHGKSEMPIGQPGKQHGSCEGRKARNNGRHVAGYQ